MSRASAHRPGGPVDGWARRTLIKDTRDPFSGRESVAFRCIDLPRSASIRVVGVGLRTPRIQDQLIQNMRVDRCLVGSDLHRDDLGAGRAR